FVALLSLLYIRCPLLFFFYSYGDHPALPSFPTRRSSDLPFQRSSPASASSRRAARAISMSGLRAVAFGPCLRREGWTRGSSAARSEEHTSELQSRGHLVCRLLLEKKKGTRHRSIAQPGPR